MGANLYANIQHDELFSAEERMALLVGPRAELTRKKRIEEEMLIMLIVAEDRILQKRLLAKLEQNILTMCKFSESMNSIGEVYDMDESQTETSACCSVDNEERMTVNPPAKCNDELSESTQLAGLNQKSGPVKWFLRAVDGLPNPKSRSLELEFRNKNRKASDSKKKKSVTLNFSLSGEKEAKSDPIECQRVPTSSEKNSDCQNTKEDEVFEEGVGIELLNGIEEGEIVDDYEHGGQTVIDSQQNLKAAQPMPIKTEQPTSQNDAIFGEFVSDPMTPPTIHDCERVPSPKTPPPALSSHRYRIKEVFKRRERERSMRVLDIITLDEECKLLQTRPGAVRCHSPTDFCRCFFEKIENMSKHISTMSILFNL